MPNNPLNRRKKTLATAVHVRTWLEQLRDGLPLNVYPGSPDHEMLAQIQEYLDWQSWSYRNALRRKSTPRKATAKPASLRLRDLAERRREEMDAKITAYLDIYHPDWGGTPKKESRTEE